MPRVRRQIQLTAELRWERIGAMNEELFVIRKPDGTLAVEPLSVQPGDCAEVLIWNTLSGLYETTLVSLAAEPTYSPNLCRGSGRGFGGGSKLTTAGTTSTHLASPASGQCSGAS